ncbi:cornifelin homolog B-like [Xyrichtys novacula]|uniref:Cornifelin homolog B-like n=1 Tax=Xyrichtys novacula TaxID=13765 RepID=A0AAV1FQG4_XYRNO|nr:cornifelin homolog B-like [Xyrichtys novacula]
MSWPVDSQPQSVDVLSDAAEWSSGICDCCQDKRECCFAFWCCPCFACITTKALGQCLCLPLLDVCGCIPSITMAMRVSVRHRYGIRVRTKIYSYLSGAKSQQPLCQDTLQRSRSRLNL